MYTRTPNAMLFRLYNRSPDARREANSGSSSPFLIHPSQSRLLSRTPDLPVTHITLPRHPLNNKILSDLLPLGTNGALLDHITRLAILPLDPPDPLQTLHTPYPNHSLLQRRHLGPIIAQPGRDEPMTNNPRLP